MSSWISTPLASTYTISLFALISQLSPVSRQVMLFRPDEFWRTIETIYGAGDATLTKVIALLLPFIGLGITLYILLRVLLPDIPEKHRQKTFGLSFFLFLFGEFHMIMSIVLAVGFVVGAHILRTESAPAEVAPSAHRVRWYARASPFPQSKSPRRADRSASNTRA